MTHVDADPAADAVLREYLHRLHAAAWALDPARRDELVDEVREHIDAALADEPSTTGQGHEVAARNVLERLGPPEDIVRAETEDGLAPPRVVDAAVPAANVVQEPSWGALEIAAIAALAVGSLLLPVFGPLVGIVLMWASPRWHRDQKVMATLLACLPLLLVLSFLVVDA